VTENGLAPGPLDGGGQKPVAAPAAQEVAVGAAAGAAARAGQAADRPEVPVAAAFAGGFVLAMVLKRLGR
jgi:hypothetical protein